MLASADRLADRHLEGMALAHRGRAEWQSHDLETAEETLGAALAVADEGFEDVRFYASAILGVALLVFNRHAEAQPFLRMAEELAPVVDDRVSRGWWGVAGSWSPRWKGRYDDALKHLARERGAFEKSGAFLLLGHQWFEALARAGKGE